MSWLTAYFILLLIKSTSLWPVNDRMAIQPECRRGQYANEHWLLIAWFAYLLCVALRDIGVHVIYVEATTRRVTSSKMRVTCYIGGQQIRLRHAAGRSAAVATVAYNTFLFIVQRGLFVNIGTTLFHRNCYWLLRSSARCFVYLPRIILSSTVSLWQVNLCKMMFTRRLIAPSSSRLV